MSGTAADRILAVARTQFLEMGFERCSMDRVAQAARVSKQTLYALYPTKVDLFGTVMRDAALKARDKIRQVAVDGRPPERVLYDFMRSFFDGFLTLESRGLYRATLVAARHFPDLAAELHRHRLSGGAPLVAYLQELARTHHLRADDSTELSRHLGNIAVEGLRYLMGTPHPSEDEQRLLAQRAVALFLNGYASGLDLPEPLPSDPPPLLATPGSGAALRLSQQRLDSLFDAAATEFLASGSHGANLTRIVAASGVSATTIYRQFGDKLGLFRRAIAHLCTKVWDDESPEPVEGPTLDAALENLALWTLERHLRPESLALQRLLIIESEQFPDVACWAYDRMIERTTRALRARLEAFRAPPPDAIAARAFFTLATYGVRFIITPESPDRSTRVALSSECVQLFLHGCRTA